MSVEVDRLEMIVDRSEIAQRIEAALPAGVRPRQLSVRTLLLGMLLTQADSRPAHLSRVHQALLGLDEEARRRLGVVLDWKQGPHTLTYRQVERTFSLVMAALTKDVPDGTPTKLCQEVLDQLLESSVPIDTKNASRALAVD